MNPRPLILALGALATATTLASCGTVSTSDTKTESGAGYPVDVSTCGRDVTVDAAPKRVVSMHPSLTELLVELGVGDRVVAQAQDALGEPSPDLKKQVDRIPSISKDTPPTKEDLLEQEPDLVVSGTEYEFNAEAGFADYKALDRLGVEAYVAKAGCIDRRSQGTIADTFDDIEALGRVFGQEDRAREMIDDAKGDLREVADVVGDDDPVPAVQVYVEGGKLYAIGGAVEIDVLRLGGGRNLFAGDSRFSDFFAAEVNPEVVLAKRPEALVFAYNDAKHKKSTEAYLRSRLASTPAVRSGTIIGVDNTVVQPGTLAAIGGARQVAEALHG